ncbi:hypothetical protein AKJ09_07077 [Labilithrix luteola]|uniref:Uncharacterized protein n=1 Tax=Labilithrix luteola TaxID=1391654 RepID=A0A0K1Q3V9_9BACT|nr:hypothetical protein AKJ09_07077 [Labilithrix luteola]
MQFAQGASTSIRNGTTSTVSRSISYSTEMKRRIVGRHFANRVAEVIQTVIRIEGPARTVRIVARAPKEYESRRQSGRP